MCEVYRLQRDSFCLAVDFVDRYLAKEQNIKKNQLQLLGITALFIAAKLEEIYPPKLSEFAYVTDGACTESEILDKELVMLKVSFICKLYILLLLKKLIENNDNKVINVYHVIFCAYNVIRSAGSCL